MNQIKTLRQELSDTIEHFSHLGKILWEAIQYDFQSIRQRNYLDRDSLRKLIEEKKQARAYENKT